MSVTRFSEAIGYVPDLNGCRKKIIEHCRDWESTVYRLQQENEQLIQTSHNANKELRNKVDRLEQENAELRELATMVVNLSKISDVPISITSKAKQLLNK